MSRSPGLLARATAVATAALFVLGAGLALADNGGDNIQPVDFSHNGVQDAAPVAGAVFGTGPAYKTGQAICTTVTRTRANVNTDCEKAAGPHNETSIAVNPLTHYNIIGGANDYQLGSIPVATSPRAAVARACHVRWRPDLVDVSDLHSNSAIRARAIRPSRSTMPATLTTRRSASASSARPTPRIPDVIVGNSADGGKTWKSVRVARAAASRPAWVICSTRSTSPPGATATPSSPLATSALATRAAS